MRIARVLVDGKEYYGEVKGDEIILENKETRKLREVKILPPLKPYFIVCTLVNSAEMLGFSNREEARRELGSPKFFIKLQNTLAGNGDLIEVPESGFRPEVEIAVVIREKLRNSSRREVVDSVLGYTVFNDVTAPGEAKKDNYFAYRRDPTDGKVKKMLMRGSHFRNKNAPNFSPLGPWIVTKDEIDVEGLSMRSYFNNSLIQEGNSSQLIFDIEEILEELSKIIEIPPYSIVTSGTIGYKGVEDQSEFKLKAVEGVMAVEVEGIGRLENPIKSKA